MLKLNSSLYSLLWNHALVKVLFILFIDIFDTFIFLEWRLSLDNFESLFISGYFVSKYLVLVRCLFVLVPRTGREAWPESVGHVQSVNQEDVAPEVIDAQESGDGCVT